MARATALIIGCILLAGCDIPAPTSNPEPAPAQEAPKPKPEPKPIPDLADDPVTEAPVNPVIVDEPKVDVPPATDPRIATAEPVTAGRVEITKTTTSGDTCGAADYSFLKGEPFAITFDVALPGNAVVLGRSQKADGENPKRMIVRVSSKSAAAAANSPDATITNVSCG